MRCQQSCLRQLCGQIDLKLIAAMDWLMLSLHSSSIVAAICCTSRCEQLGRSSG